jgi:hypothetical protein
VSSNLASSNFRTVQEIMAAYGTNIGNLGIQRSRYMKKLTDYREDIKKSMGRFMLLDWSKDVKYYIDSNIDSDINDQNLINTYALYVNELLQFLQENMQSSQADQDTLRLLNEMGMTVKKLNDDNKNLKAEIAKLSNQIREQKASVIPVVKKSKASVVIQPQVQEFKSSVLEEESDDVNEPEVDSEEESDPVQANNTGVEQSVKSKEIQLEEKQPEQEEIIVAPPPVVVEPVYENLKYLKDIHLKPMFEFTSKEFLECKDESTRIRNGNPDLFPNYGTIEHRYYKSLARLLGRKLYALNFTQKNPCRMCKKEVPSLKSRFCNLQCRNDFKRFQNWYKAHFDQFRNVDPGLKVV